MTLWGPLSDASVRDCPFRSGSVGTTGRQGRRTAPVENFSQDLRPDLVDGPMTVPMWCSHRLREESATRICRKIEPPPLRRPRAHVPASVK